MKKNLEKINTFLIKRVRLLLKRKFNLTQISLTYQTDDPAKREIEEGVFEAQIKAKEALGYVKDGRPYVNEFSKVQIMKRRL
ncbi:MAG: hypothetical protein WCK59_02565 [Candidatus Falkowbacteria bacterium]